MTIANLNVQAELQGDSNDAPTSPEVPSSTIGMTSLRTEVIPNQGFQAQLDAIDKELARFDNLEKDKENDLAAQSSGIRSQVMGLALFLEREKKKKKKKNPLYPNQANQTTPTKIKVHPSGKETSFVF